MNYQEFIANITNHFKERLPEGARIEIQQVTKNNDTVYDAIVAYTSESEMAPSIYLNPYYNQYTHGKDLDEIQDAIWTSYCNNLPKESIDARAFLNFENAKNNLVLRVVNKERNQSLLLDVPHRDFLEDLAIVYYCYYDKHAAGQYSILVHNHHMEVWQTNEETLYQIAMENTPKLLPSKFCNMYEALSHMEPEDMDIDDLSYLPMHVLTNKLRTNGASVLAYPKLMDRIAGMLKHDLIIIPSSIHEVLVVPMDDGYHFDFYSDMINEVNTTQLHPEEILSSHPYYYFREEGFCPISNETRTHMGHTL